MIIEFHPVHIGMIDVQELQLGSAKHLNDELLTNVTNAFTYVEGGQVKASIGLNAMWGSYAVAWALIGHIDNWVKFHREVSKLLDRLISELKLKRIEMTTEFKQADRWAKMLGFSFVADLPFYGPNEEHTKLWVRYN